jgi:hypothetical protein
MMAAHLLEGNALNMSQMLSSRYCSDACHAAQSDPRFARDLLTVELAGPRQMPERQLEHPVIDQSSMSPWELLVAGFSAA